MQILSSFTHAKVVPDLPYYGEKKYYMEVYQQLFGKQQFWEHPLGSVNITHTGLEKLEDE